jgi:hypothetical protein
MAGTAMSTWDKIKRETWGTPDYRPNHWWHFFLAFALVGVWMVGVDWVLG